MTAHADTIDTLRAENERLTRCLKSANESHEHFEREWYLRGDEIESLCAQLTEAQDALHAAQRLIKEALPKFNWGASFLDANAIQLLNEVLAKVNAAIDAAEGEKNGA